MVSACQYQKDDESVGLISCPHWKKKAAILDKWISRTKQGVCVEVGLDT